jgi:ABC-2 type transport system ATP-binding protein
MNNIPIRTVGLTKYYGEVHALVDLDLEVQPGEVFGFLGPNGSGKTTTIRGLLNFIRPTRGGAEIFGLDAVKDSVGIRRLVGYMPSEYEMYDKLTGAQMLQYYANLRGGVDEDYVAELAERMKADLSRKMHEYSTGNKQKICLIQAFMNKPRLLILDEPSTGLDPLIQQELLTLIDEVRSDGRTVFLSSHTLSEVERVADRVGILRQGHLVEVARLDELVSKAVRRLDLEFRAPVDRAVFTGIPHVRSVTSNGFIVNVSYDGPIKDLLQVALDHDIVNLNSREADLEDVFLSYYRDQPDEVSDAD